MYDVAILGAGPAGLAAAVAGRLLGVEVVILEQGKPLHERSLDEQSDIVSGVGGAGLCSDGKFSFFPSATALWSVQPPGLLEIGYHWLEEILNAAGMPVPIYPKNVLQEAQPCKTGLIRKSYPSYYLPIEERNAIVCNLTAQVARFIRPQCRVLVFEQSADGSVSLRGEDGLILAKAHQLVVASGRLGPLMLHRALDPDELVFRRVEIGIRIEQPAEHFMLARDRCLDPKLVITNGSEHSWRTFCCCRNGEVLAANSASLTSVSGRADCPPTGRSNVGFMLRFTDARTGMAAWKEALRSQPLEVPAVEHLDEMIDAAGQLRAASRALQTLGAETASRLADGLDHLRTSLRTPIVDAVIHTPAIEGVGWYPRVGPDLRIPHRPVFVAGDATGMFRGLTAALVSGYVAGSAAAQAAIDGTSRRARR